MSITITDGVLSTTAKTQKHYGKGTIRKYEVDGYHNKSKVGSHYLFYGSSEVVKSENLLNIDKFVEHLKNVDPNGTYTFSNGVLTINPANSQGYIQPFIIDGIDGDWSISGTIENVSATNPKIGIATYDGTNVTDRTSAISIGVSFLTTNSKRNAIFIDWTVMGEYKVTNIMISKGTTSKTYTPYFEPYIKNKGELGDDGHYHIMLGSNDIDIGTSPLREGDTYCTDGVRKTKVESESVVNGALSQTLLATHTTIVGQAYSLDSGLVGADIETPRYALNYGNVSSIKVESENIWDEVWESGVIGTDGTLQNSTTQIRCKNYIEVLPGEKYYCRYENGSGKYWICIFFYDENKTFFSRVWNSNLAFTTPNNAKYIKFCTNSETFSYGGVYKNDIAIFEGTTAKPYVPYYKDSVAMNCNVFQNGKLENNILTNDYGIVNAWELSWTYNNTYFYVDIDSNVSAIAKGYTDALMTTYNNANTHSALNDLDFTFANSSYSGASGRLFIKDTRFTDVTLFKQYLQANQVKIIYKLASKSVTDVSVGTSTSFYNRNFPNYATLFKVNNGTYLGNSYLYYYTKDYTTIGTATEKQSVTDSFGNSGVLDWKNRIIEY